MFLETSAKTAHNVEEARAQLPRAAVCMRQSHLSCSCAVLTLQCAAATWNSCITAEGAGAAAAFPVINS